MLPLALLLPWAEDGATQTQNPLGPLPLVLGGLVLFYFLLIRPMRKQERERQTLLTSLKKGDKIVTTSGIYGTVVAVADKEDEITVKVDDNVRLRMLKGVVQRNLTNEEAAKAGKPAAAPKSEAVTTKPGDGR